MLQNLERSAMVFGGIVIGIVILIGIGVIGIIGAGNVSNSAKENPQITFTPSSTPVPAGVIAAQIRSEGWYESARTEIIYELTETREYPTALISGSGKLSYKVVYEITAGIDLETFTEQSVTVEDENVTIYVPKVQIRECILDQQKSQFYDYDCTATNILGVEVANVCDELESGLLDLSPSKLADANYGPLLEVAELKATDFLENLIETISPDLDLDVVYTEYTADDLFSDDGSCSSIVEG